MTLVTSQLPAAVLLDMDGTLIDSEPYWMTAETELVESFGGVWTHEDAMGQVGSGLFDSAHVFQDRGVDLPAAEIIGRLTSRVVAQLSDSVPWRPGARELVAALAEAAVPTAIVTMSMRTMADPIARLLGIDHVVSGDDVDNEKPHPEPYLRGAELLGVAAIDCVAIEDSRPGLASAVASGAAVIGVPAHIPLEPSPDYTLWPTLEGKTLDDIAAVFSAQRLAS
nr:HAD family phosphatase [Cryobacterium sp. BB736]